MNDTVKLILILAGLVLLGVLFLALLLTRKRRIIKRRGREGEREVAAILGGNKRGERYVFHDLLFKIEDNSCEIDHVLISPRGVFVIETKNYSGVIFGSEESGEWSQELKDGQIRHTFYNPVKQNRTHILRLANYLKLGENYFQNVVVFLEGADVSNVHSPAVCSVSDLPSVLSRKTGVVLSRREIKCLYKHIKVLNKEHSISRREHVKEIKRREKLIKKGICPRCGKKLVKKKGKDGIFYACSNKSCKFKTEKK